MSEQPIITFIICTYNRARYLDETLNSLRENDFTNSNCKLLVVDNNSSDETPAVVKKHRESLGKDGKAIHYIKETNQGLSYARNRGIQEATTPYVVFLDDDIVATNTFISAWQSFFIRYPEAIAAGGKIHVQFDDPRPNWMSHFLLPLLGYHDLGDTFKKYSGSSYPFGGNMGFKKSIFKKIGLFHTDLGRKGESLNAGEEKELFRRLRERSVNIYYLPEAFIYHRVNSSRLTLDYIREQALGLGQSMRLRLENASSTIFFKNWIIEFGKLLSSFPLAAVYLLSFQPAKAGMLFRFRWWIWKGYKNQV